VRGRGYSASSELLCVVMAHKSDHTQQIRRWSWTYPNTVCSHTTLSSSDVPIDGSRTDNSSSRTSGQRQGEQQQRQDEERATFGTVGRGSPPYHDEWPFSECAPHTNTTGVRKIFSSWLSHGERRTVTQRPTGLARARPNVRSDLSARQRLRPPVPSTRQRPTSFRVSCFVFSLADARLSGSLFAF
jgi:hypothetical protein